MRDSQDIRSKILLYFLLGIALPSLLLGFLAFRGIQNERALFDRERRAELEAASDRIVSAVADRLSALSDSVRRSEGDDLSSMARSHDAVEAVLVVDSSLAVHLVGAKGLYFGRPVGSELAPDGQRSHPRLAAARRLEMNRDMLPQALSAYQRLAKDDASAGVRGEALMGVARVHRKAGRLAAAARSYTALISDSTEARTSFGLPIEAAARLELGTIHLEEGDTATAAAVILDFYGALVDGRWVLSAPQFDLLLASALAMVEPLKSAAELMSADTLEVLKKEAEFRRREAALLQEVEIGTEQFLARTDMSAPEIRASIDLGRRVFPAVILGGTVDEERLRRGFIFKPGAIVDRAVRDVLQEDTAQFTWSLRTPATNHAVSPAASSANELSTLRDFPGFPRWSIRMTYSGEAMADDVFASRRAAYLVAFVLIAGILVSGLIFTLRTIGRELELARMKSDFVSTVSHEFKSPLTAIRQLAEMLRAGRVASEEHRTRYYEVLLEQSERLSLLVDNVLDFARAEAGRRPLVLEAVNPADLVQEVVGDARQRVAHENFNIRTVLEPGLPHTRLDRYAFRQALGNLIDNAVKYSGESREIIVGGSRSNGDLVVSVQDFGIGLEAEQLSRVFDRFYRGGQELTRRVKGTGLGLALVKQVVEAHGGNVEVESEAGRGSIFSMRFPVIPTVHSENGE